MYLPTNNSSSSLTCTPITLSISLTSACEGPMCRLANDSSGGKISFSRSWLSTGHRESARWRTQLRAARHLLALRAPNRRSVNCRKAISGNQLRLSKIVVNSAWLLFPSLFISCLYTLLLDYAAHVSAC